MIALKRISLTLVLGGGAVASYAAGLQGVALLLFVFMCLGLRS